jgi:hypothetical protein
VREAAQALTFRAMAIRKYLRNEHPYDRALSDRVSRDERENANGNDRVMFLEKSPSDQRERGNVAE